MSNFYTLNFAGRKKRSRKPGSVLLAILCCWFATSCLLGQTQIDGKQQQRKSVREKRRVVLMEFVRENHLELEKLIDSLQEKRPDQYQQVLQILDRDVQRLNRFQKDADPQRYTRQLENWKLKSRVQLASAQLSITDTPAKRKQLRQLFALQIDARTKALEADIARLNQRLKSSKESLAEVKTTRDSEIKRQLDRAIKTAERIQSKRKKEEEATRLEKAQQEADKSAKADRANRNRQKKSRNDEKKK